MAIRFRNDSTVAQGIINTGAIQYGNFPSNIDRLFVFRIKILQQAAPTSSISIGRSRVFATDPAGASTIRFRLAEFPQGSGGPNYKGFSFECNRSSGGSYQCQWANLSAEPWFDVENPWRTYAVRFGSTPGSGRTDLWQDGIKQGKTESNPSGNFQSITHTNTAAFSVASLGDNTRGLWADWAYTYAWLGQDALANSSAQVFTDDICAALSRGVSPTAIGLPVADIGYKFDADGNVIPTGNASVQAIASDGAAAVSGGLYRFATIPVIAAAITEPEPVEGLPITIADPVADAEDSIDVALAPQTASIIDPVPDAQDDLSAAISAIASTIIDPVPDAIDSIQSAIATDLLPVIINDPIADAEDAVAGSLGAVGFAIDDPVADAQDAIQGQLNAIALAIDDPVANALDQVFAIRIGARSIAIDDPVADSIDAVGVKTQGSNVAIADPVADAIDSVLVALPVPIVRVSLIGIVMRQQKPEITIRERQRPSITVTLEP